MYYKELEDFKNKHTKMASTIYEMKNILERINSRITEAKERISDVGDKVVEITSTEKINEKNEKN